MRGEESTRSSNECGNRVDMDVDGAIRKIKTRIKSGGHTRLCVLSAKMGCSGFDQFLKTKTLRIKAVQ